jgi:cold shock protein
VTIFNVNTTKKMQTGTVKFFNESKGFGFILDDDSGQEIFVHVTALGGTHIRQDDKVSFNIVDGKRGLNAADVKKL